MNLTQVWLWILSQWKKTIELKAGCQLDFVKKGFLKGSVFKKKGF